MAEKRRGLGRGLGALIPSAPAEEIPEQFEPEMLDVPVEDNGPASRKQGGRPVDLFFERVTEEDVAEQPRSYSSALRSGINKNVLDAQTKRVAKGSARKAPSVTHSPRGAKTAGKESAIAPRTDEAASPVLEEGAGSAPEHGADPVGQVSSVESKGTKESGRDGVDRHATIDPQGTRSRESDGAASASAVADESSSPRQHNPATDVSRETAPEPTVPDRADRALTSDLVDVPGARFAELALTDIHPNRKQPRTEFNEEELAELVHSIREIGVLQPVVVRPSKEVGDAPYELVMGERRLRASREAGMGTIPAIIRSTLDDDLLRDALLENLHRSALNPLEEAAAYQQLLDDFGCSHDELAGRLGRSRPQISNTLRLMKLPPLVQRRVAAGILSAGHARALLGLNDPAEMEKLAQRIVAEGLSVRSTEEVVALSGGLRRAGKQSAPRDGARHERLDYLATSLSDRLDTSVKITLGAKKGRVSIEFASVDDLNRIIGVLTPTKD
ncbi:ParB/RepB/Spo0J family partition protein [Arthrobacter pityocampae]|uniref:ParB/RepB/Spo0J family partition protein n=1 Tax=Arthrobacter pityocampae TaxID=547334 RepID=UPI003734F537